MKRKNRKIPIRKNKLTSKLVQKTTKTYKKASKAEREIKKPAKI